MASPPGHNGQMDRESMRRLPRWPHRAPGVPGQAGGGPGQARSRLQRAVAFVRSADQRTSPGRRAIAADIALAAAATAAAVVTIALALDHPVTGPASGLRGYSVHVTAWQAVLLTIAATAPLAIRRLRPLTAFWVILAATLATPGLAINPVAPLPAGSGQMPADLLIHRSVVFFAVVLAAYSAVAHSPFRRAAIMSVPAAGILVATAFPGVAPALPGRYTALLVLIPVVFAGNAMYRWRHRARDSQARMLGLQAGQQATTRRALELERARIASELHDVVTHNVSVMIVQAGAARQVLAGAPAEATAALLAVESSGRAAMGELRHLLGLLSPLPAPGDGTGADASGTPADRELWPLPGLGQLQSLVDRVTAAGLPVEVHAGGVPQGLPPGLDLAVFRVIQEALTNVIKHAGKPRTSVRLDYCGGDLVVEVADAGRTAGPAGPAVPGAGRGLLGLRERTALYGGELDAGPRPGGGWLIRARIPVGPLPAAAPSPAPAASASLAPLAPE